MHMYAGKHADFDDLPLSVVAAHNQVFVALSCKQLYQRSVISESVHIHQDYRKERKKERRVSSYDTGINSDCIRDNNNEFTHLLQGGDEEHGQGDQMQHSYGYEEEYHGCLNM